MAAVGCLQAAAWAGCTKSQPIALSARFTEGWIELGRLENIEAPFFFGKGHVRKGVVSPFRCAIILRRYAG